MEWSLETSIKTAKLLRQYDVLWLEEQTISDDTKESHKKVV